MKNQEENPLLKEILADDALAELRRASLDQGLAALRRARRVRRTIRGGMLAIVPLFVVIALIWHQPSQEIASRPQTAGSQPGQQAQPVMPAAAPEESGIKMISDEELFALFPGRSLALIGSPGQQELVFLDLAANH